MAYIDTLEHLFGGQRRFFGKKVRKIVFFEMGTQIGHLCEILLKSQGSKSKSCPVKYKNRLKSGKKWDFKAKKKFWGIFRQKNP